MRVFIVFLFLHATSSAVLAESKEAKEIKDLREQVRLLQTSVRELQEVMKLQKTSVIPQTENKPVDISSGKVSGQVPSALQSKSGSLVPDIGVVADVVASSSQSNEDEDGNDRLSLRELELVFGHDIDPYARFDSTITFSDQEDPDIEEAYVSYWDLPFGLRGKVGRMREKIGKASSIHRDSLDTVEEPLVVQNFLGHEGLFRTGLELSGFTPLSSSDGTFSQELTGGVMEGGGSEGSEVLGETRRHPSYYAHLKNFYELGDYDNLELGGTYLLGSNDDDSAYEVNLFGLDFSAVHKFTAIQKIKFQVEGFFQDHASTLETGSEGLVANNRQPWGLYSIVDLRFAERWGAGLRYDYLEPVNLEAVTLDHKDQAMTAYFTFFQSEFARWRFEYQFADLMNNQTDNRLFLQGTFAIGTHKHQLQ